jgi:hypothetical protein
VRREFYVRPADMTDPLDLGACFEQKATIRKLIHVREITPGEKSFTREEIINLYRKVEKQLGYEPTVHDLMDELFGAGGET